METLTLDLPAMYGDHHVVEVRRVLLEISGVEDVYASSSFQVAEITYDPKKVEPDDIKAALDEAGYLQDLAMPVESGEPAISSNGKEFFRHTAVYEQTRHVVGFTQNVSFSGRPLWPCPGMGVVNTMSEEE
jgi:copper chaperone CopZ